MKPSASSTLPITDNHGAIKIRATTPPWGSLAIIVVMIAGSFALETTDGQHVHLRGWPSAVLPEICWSRRWLGWSCPLCGSTRSMILLMRGRWAESWSMQPAGTLVLLTAVVSAGISWFGYLWRPRYQSAVSVLTQTLWIGIFLILICRHAWNALS